MVCDALHERLRLIRSAALPGVELRVVYNSTRRWHGFNERYAFVACRNADARVRYRGRDQSVRDGSVLVREPGEAHSCTAIAKPADFKVLYVEAPLIADAARELGHTGSLHFEPVPLTDQTLFDLLWRLCGSIEDGDDDLEQQYLFATAMCELARHSRRPARAMDLNNGKLAVARAKAYLNQHCSEPVSLLNLSRVSGLSRFGLVHAFTREVGLSPHAYQVHVRVERARVLLHEGLSPATVATTMGFADQSHFTRHFKRILQVTPSQYARPRAAVPKTLLYGPSLESMDSLSIGQARL
jgi:AraC-like DNA-binding protein